MLAAGQAPGGTTGLRRLTYRVFPSKHRHQHAINTPAVVPVCAIGLRRTEIPALGIGELDKNGYLFAGEASRDPDVFTALVACLV